MKQKRRTKCACCGGAGEPLGGVTADDSDQDAGQGFCLACGGDPNADVGTDEGCRAFYGRMGCHTIDRALVLLMRALNPTNSVALAAMSYNKKSQVAMAAMQDGWVTV